MFVLVTNSHPSITRPLSRSYPPSTRTRPRSYSQKRGTTTRLLLVPGCVPTRSLLVPGCVPTRPWTSKKKLVYVRGRVRARCGFGHVRVREVPVAVTYPRSNSHMKSNSCAALPQTQAICVPAYPGLSTSRPASYPMNRSVQQYRSTIPLLRSWRRRASCERKCGGAV